MRTVTAPKTHALRAAISHYLCLAEALTPAVGQSPIVQFGRTLLFAVFAKQRFWKIFLQLNS